MNSTELYEIVKDVPQGGVGRDWKLLTRRTKQSDVNRLAAALAKARAEGRAAAFREIGLRPRSEWHEDYGTVL